MYNSRRIGTKHRVKLRKSRDGFGIKIAERDNSIGHNRPIYITAITSIGSAIKDGRLKEGDMLLEANGVDLTKKSLSEVTKMLKLVGVDETVEFVISRQEDNRLEDQSKTLPKSLINEEHPQKSAEIEKSLIDLDIPDDGNFVLSDIKNRRLNEPNVDGPGTYVYDVPLNDSKSAGLGLYLKYPTMQGKDLGIWIEKVITGGAAWKDGRLRPYDQILAINGINLTGLSNADASEALTAAVCRGVGRDTKPNTIRLNIHRRDPAVVAEILDGANNRPDDSQPCHVPDKANNTDSNSHSRSQSFNSQNDSAMQTQASNSLRFSSSAISQNTDFSDLPNMSSEIASLPKSNDNNSENKEPAPSVQSWDDESVDSATGEERFQRDGFGRQSISEKRHAKLMAENTDTYKRNRKLREEREKEKKLQQEEKLSSKSEVDVRNGNDNVAHNGVWNAKYETSTDDTTYQAPTYHEGYDKRTNHHSLRITRNRKINDSFRAAVDRSYGTATNDIQTSSKESQFVYTHVHTHTHTHVHTHTHTPTHTYTQTQTHTQTQTQTHTQLRTQSHTQTHTHLHTHAHKHTYTHTHIDAPGVPETEIRRPAESPRTRDEHSNIFRHPSRWLSVKLGRHY